MRVKMAVPMGQGQVAVHGRYGSPIGWFQRGGFPGDDQKPVGPVEFEANGVRHADHV